MLSFIPTPIGNTEDITLRALKLMKQLNVFFCEDTRMTKKLLQIYEIDYAEKKFYSLTSFTKPHQLSKYQDILQDTDAGVLSDAGTPWVSDPGKQLIKLCREGDVSFEILPGANALIPAVVGSYFDTSSFTFFGFLPKKKGKQTMLKYIVQSDYPVFIYESVHRVEKTLGELQAVGFEWTVCLFRELTKMFEQKEKWSIQEVLTKIENGDIKPKGEFVIGFYPTSS